MYDFAQLSKPCSSDNSPDSIQQKEDFANKPDSLDKYCHDVEGELNKRFTLVLHSALDLGFV